LPGHARLLPFLGLALSVQRDRNSLAPWATRGHLSLDIFADRFGRGAFDQWHASGAVLGGQALVQKTAARTTGRNVAAVYALGRRRIRATVGLAHGRLRRQHARVQTRQSIKFGLARRTSA